MKYTKGPWEVSRLATPEYHPQYGIYNGGNDFCIVKGENAETDATLIAASPELLEAAMWVLGNAMDRGECYDDIEGGMYEDWKALYEAVEKAYPNWRDDI